MKIFVTGPTGFIGEHLVRSLEKENHEVFCLERKKNDINDRNIDLQGAQAVFHLAGLLGKHGIPEDEYWRVNFKGTKNILDLAGKAGVKKFVHVSTGGAADPITIYEKSKAEAEEEALKRSTEMNITIVRPEFVYGPGDRHVLGLFQAVQKPFPLFNGGRAELYPTYIDDVIFALRKSMELENSGDVITVSGEGPVTVKELAGRMAEAAGAKFRPVPVPKWAGLAAGKLFETFSKEPPMTRSMVEFFSQSRGSGNRLARELIGLEPTSLDEGLARTVKWYKENNLL